MITKLICKNIVWDTDGEKVALPDTIGINLMTTSRISSLIEDYENGSTGAIANYLSNVTGWCVESFDVEAIEEDEGEYVPLF